MAADDIELGQVVVTATRTEEALASIPSSVTVITAEEIEQKQAATVLEVLRAVQGVDVVQSGGPGKATSIFIRGGNSGHTLVMIDGVKVNSPTLGSYNFADLSVDNIERIEIIRGPQSTLYGSDAMTGVINIITKKGEDAPEITVSAEGGSYNTRQFSLSALGSKNKIDYSISISRLDTGGFSTARDGIEKDGYENTTFSGRFGAHPFENLVVEMGLRYTAADTDIDFYYDPLTFSMTDDAIDYTQETRSLTPYLKATHIVNEDWDHAVTLSMDDVTSVEKKDSGTTSEIYTKIESIDWQHNLYLADGANTLTLGFGYEKQSGENGGDGNFDESIHNRAFYLQDQASLLAERLSLSAGLRIDDHSRFGKKTTSRIAALYIIEKTDTRLRGSWGTGFKAPTLNDLFFNASWGRGNPDLKPEKSIGYDLGAEQSIGDSVLISALYFRNEFNSLIQWDWSVYPMIPQNVSEAETRGWELGVTADLQRDIQLNGSYTLTETEDRATGKALQIRPREKAGISATWNPEKVNVTASCNYVGNRWNNADNTQRLDSYIKVDLAFSYDIKDSFRIFGRVENLTDKHYEEVKAYGTPGRSYYAGLKANF